MRRPLWVLSFVGALLARDAVAQLALGPEFQVNTFSLYPQANPAVASDAAGNFVVAWQSRFQEANSYDVGYGIFARKFLSSGAPLGSSEFRVNTYTTNSQRFPSIAMSPSGAFVVVWSSDGQDGSDLGVFGRRFDATGIPGPEFQVNTYTTGAQARPRVAMSATGDFVVVWHGYDETAGVLARRYDGSGTPLGSEFPVNSYTTTAGQFPSVAMDADGDFDVAWHSNDVDGSGSAVLVRRYKAGIAQGAEFRVNSYTLDNQYFASIAMDGAGAFIVVWGSEQQDGSSGGVFGRRYNATGVPVGSEFQVNTYTTDAQSSPQVALGPDGRFVIAWASHSRVGNERDNVYARTFNSSGVAMGSEFELNTYTPYGQYLPVIATQPSGRFVVAWNSDGQDTDYLGVFGRLFATDLIFQDDFESGDLSKWSPEPPTSTDAGDLFPSVVAAMKFTSVGLEGNVDDATPIFVQDDTPLDEDRYRARFYFNTNGFDPGEAGGAHRTRMFIAFEEAPNRRLATIVLRRINGAYALEGRARKDDGTQADTGFFPIADGPHSVEFDWKRSSGPDANDGAFQLWIDGSSVKTLTGLDNSLSSVDFVRLGALAVKATANGTLFWDEFESRRISYIGN